jgi:hypothetical protein
MGVLPSATNIVVIYSGMQGDKFQYRQRFRATIPKTAHATDMRHVFILPFTHDSDIELMVEEQCLHHDMIAVQVPESHMQQSKAYVSARIRAASTTGILGETGSTAMLKFVDDMDASSYESYEKHFHSLTNKNSDEYAPSVVIFTYSGSHLHEKRTQQRNICRKLYGDIPHKFAVGLPSFDDRPVNGHQQAQLATPREVSISKELLQQDALFGDIMITPHRDHYRDLTEKLLGVLREGVHMGADYIFKTDDDVCLNISSAMQVIREHEQYHSEHALYVGYYLWDPNIVGHATYNKIFDKVPGQAPYVSGGVIGVSRSMAQTILKDWNVHALRAVYGSSAEDANMGSMVQYAAEHADISVRTVVDPNLQAPFITTS